MKVRVSFVRVSMGLERAWQATMPVLAQVQAQAQALVQVQVQAQAQAQVLALAVHALVVHALVVAHARTRYFFSSIDTHFGGVTSGWNPKSSPTTF
jgi:hypothetical protein